MTRHASAAVAQRNASILPRIQVLKAEPPFWGYRRIWAQRRFVDGLPINKKRVLRLRRTSGLLVKPNVRLKATRTPSRSKPRPTAPNQGWGIDMTKVLAGQIGGVSIVLVLDWDPKTIIGQYAELQAKTAHWLAALDTAGQRQFPDGSRDHGLPLMSDNGGQPTSVAFMKAAATLGITHPFTSYHNPKGNAETERLMRTRKDERLRLRAWTSPLELERALTAWLEGGQHAGLAFRPRGSDTVSGRTRIVSQQPQHSVRGRLTNGEHYNK